MFSVEIEEAILPIELTNFALVTQDKTIHLNWETSSEQNTQNYTLQRSTDGGQTFQNIGSVPAQNNPSGAEYQYTDETAASLNTERLYYRLQAQGYDGTTQLFGPVTVEMPSLASNALKVFPNPLASGQTLNIQGVAAGDVLSLSKYAKLELRAMDGRLLTTLVPTSEGAYDLPKLKAGVYMVQTQNVAGKSQAGRFVVR